MISKNKLWKIYLHRQSIIERRSVRDIEFVIKCRSKWKVMTNTEKLVFANSDQTLSSNEEPSNEFNSSETHVFSEEIENKLIDELVENKSKEELMDTKFLFMSSNIQCKVKEEYRPLEIGIIEYTIRDGIGMNYHQFIDCQIVPYGYISEASDHMQKTHKIPIKNFMGSSSDYLQIGSRIFEILFDSYVEQQTNDFSDKPMIVFSKTEQMDQNKGALQWIGNECNEMRRQEGKDVLNFNIEVLSATKLLSSLLTAVGDCHSMVWCENVITSHAFDYAIGTDCSFHENIDCIHCAIGVPKRMAYLMSHFLRESYGIKLSAKHLPAVKAFENPRIKEEDEEEEPSLEFTLNEEDIEEKKLVVVVDDDWNPSNAAINFEEQELVGEVKSNKEDLKNKAYFEEEEGFEVPKHTKSPPFSRRTRLSHIRKGRNRHRI